MNSLVIENLRRIDNQVAKDLIAIYDKTQEDVNAEYYSSTIFKTQDNYNKSIGIINSNIIGRCNEPIINTPLTFLKGDRYSLIFSGKDKGISFGFTLVDYITKQPLLIVVIDMIKDTYVYKSIVLDIKTKTFIEPNNFNFSCEDIKNMLLSIESPLIEDIKRFDENKISEIKKG